MKRALVLVALGFGLLPLNGCGSDDSGSDPVAQCKEIMAALCSKFFGCLSAQDLQDAAAIVGNNEADCRTKYNSQCTSESVKCDSGTTYHASAAKECVSQFKALSCDEFMSDTTAQPAACDQVCQ